MKPRTPPPNHGDLDAAPFFPKNSARVPGLTYTKAAGGMTLRLGRRRWRVKARA